MSVGRVALVGAGPGDPALLTLRAAELLRLADVVAYDELVSESILALVPETAELLPVGRRAGERHPAHRIHPDVIERARRGLFVVRLKAGDPLVFGRGGEEAEELGAQGIPFEIVPGISAALGAAAYSAIPLTHRELSAQVVFSTGHRMDGGAPPPGTRGGSTLALYMASHELETNLAGLVAAGWSPSTPAALIVAATTVDERTITGTLDTLAARAAASNGAGSRLPGLVLVGDVVGLRKGIDWRAHLPLRGRRVLVASAGGGVSAVAGALRTRGGEVVELPHFVALDRADSPRLVNRADSPRLVERQVGPARWPARVDCVVLPSASAARALYAIAPPQVRQATAVAIDVRAVDEARRCGVSHVVCAEIDTTEALVVAAVRAASEPVSSAPATDARSAPHEVQQ